MKKLTSTFTVKIGVASAQTLLKNIRLKCGFIGDTARYLVRQKTFLVPKRVEHVGFVILSFEDLGFTERVNAKDFLNDSFLRQWNQKNKADVSISLCQPFDALTVGLVHLSECRVSYINVATEPLNVLDDKKRYLFYIKNDNERLYIDADFFNLDNPGWDHLYGPDELFLFRLITHKPR